MTAAASSTALRMFWYPVHRHRLEESARPQLLLAGVGVLLQVADRQHQEARRAETALEPVVVPEGLLHGMQPVAVGQALHRAQLHPFALDRETSGRTAPAARPARTVHAPHTPVLAAQMGPGEAAVVPAARRRGCGGAPPAPRRSVRSRRAPGRPLRGADGSLMQGSSRSALSAGAAAPGWPASR